MKLGVVIRDTERGKGLGTGITSVIVDYLFDNYDLIRIEAEADLENMPAQKVLDKSGFQKEGIMRKYRYHHGSYHDSILYSRVKDSTSAQCTSAQIAGDVNG